MGSHIDKDGKFQSDKYPTCPAGKVPLSVTDPTAQDLLWRYAQRRRRIDAEFSADLESALLEAGYLPAPMLRAAQFGPPLTEEELSYANLELGDRPAGDEQICTGCWDRGGQDPDGEHNIAEGAPVYWTPIAGLDHSDSDPYCTRCAREKAADRKAECEELLADTGVSGAEHL